MATLVLKCVFWGLKCEKCFKFVYIFGDIPMGYVHQFGVILVDPEANKGPKICPKLSEKGENVYLSS